MKKRNHKKSLREIEYDKELNRIKRFIREAEKRGFRFEENIIPDRPKRIREESVSKLKKMTPDSMYRRATYLNPDTDTIVTGLQGRNYERHIAAQKGAETRKSKKQNPQPPEPPERPPEPPERPSLPPQPQETPEPPEPPDYPDDVTMTLDWVREQIGAWSPQSNWSYDLSKTKENDKNTLTRILNGAISRNGERAVAIRLLNNAELIHNLVLSILYGSGDGGKKYDSGRDKVNADLVTFAAIINGGPLTIDESIALTEEAENNETPY